MKTSVSIIVSFAIICLTFMNCSKENSLVGDTSNFGSLQANSSIKDNPSAINPVNIGMEGYFKFNNNLSDNTGKLANATPTNSGLTFGPDRKGVALSAVYLNGNYGLNISKVPTNTASTIAVWVKNISVVDGMPITPDAAGLQIAKLSNTYRGIVSSPNASIMVSAGTIIVGWHLLVVTYDGAALKIYSDGQLVKSTTSSGIIPNALVGYNLAQWWNGTRWRGYMDDLRFYNRALTAAEVQSLYSL